MERVTFFDVETRHSSDDVGGWHPELMEMSIGVTLDSKNGFQKWEVEEDFWTTGIEYGTEERVNNLFNYLESYDKIIGFNIIEFDYKVLSRYLDNELIQTLVPKTIDILSLVKSNLGFRVSLNDLAKATLGMAKSGNGLSAISLWNNGQIDELFEYCKKDVLLTKQLFDYINKTGKLSYPSYGRTKEVEINIPKVKESKIIKMQDLIKYLDGYFESLILSDSVSKNQIIHLREKVNELISQFEEEHEDSDFPDYDEDFATPKLIPKSSSTRQNPPITDFTEPVDDLPF